MGARPVSLTEAAGPQGSPGTALSGASWPVVSMGLGLLTVILAAQSHSLALVLTLMLLASPALLIYRNWRAPLTYAAVWGLALSLNLTDAGAPDWLNLAIETGQSRRQGVLTLCCVLALSSSLLAGLALLLHREQQQAQEASQLLARLSPHRGPDLSERVRSQPGERLSPSAEIFNAHADHLVRIVAAFQMLKGDMTSLSDMAARLRQKAAVQKERSDIGAEQVSTLYENNDKLSTRAEAIAQTARGSFDSAERILELTRQHEDDLKGLRERTQSGREQIDRLFHQLVEVKAAMSGGKSEAELSQMVEDLTTAIYGTTQVMTLFQEKVEMSLNTTRQVARATSTLQEENAGTAGAIEDLVIQMHASQRQAMDLLSSLEYARGASQEAIAVIESAALHVIRGEALVNEMDKHLMRMKT